MGDEERKKNVILASFVLNEKWNKELDILQIYTIKKNTSK